MVAKPYGCGAESWLQSTTPVADSGVSSENVRSGVKECAQAKLMLRRYPAAGTVSLMLPRPKSGIDAALEEAQHCMQGAG